MSEVADLKQALQDVLAPEIRANRQAIADLQTTLAAMQADLASLDQRTHANTLRAVEASETRLLDPSKLRRRNCCWKCRCPC